MNSLDAEEEGFGTALLDKKSFKGTGTSVKRGASVSYGKVKRLLRERNWRAGLPLLMVMGGLFCFVVFGVFALWIALNDKLVATFIAGAVLLTIARVARDIAHS